MASFGQLDTSYSHLWRQTLSWENVSTRCCLCQGQWCILLIDVRCGKVFLTVGGSVPCQVVLESVRKKAAQSIMSKSVNSIPLWLPLQSLPRVSARSYPGMTGCDWNIPFPPHIAFDHVVVHHGNSKPYQSCSHLEGIS